MTSFVIIIATILFVIALVLWALHDDKHERKEFHKSVLENYNRVMNRYNDYCKEKGESVGKSD